MRSGHLQTDCGNSTKNQIRAERIGATPKRMSSFGATVTWSNVHLLTNCGSNIRTQQPANHIGTTRRHANTSGMTCQPLLLLQSTAANTFGLTCQPLLLLQSTARTLRKQPLLLQSIARTSGHTPQKPRTCQPLLMLQSTARTFSKHGSHMSKHASSEVSKRT